MPCNHISLDRLYASKEFVIRFYWNRDQRCAPGGGGRQGRAKGTNYTPLLFAWPSKASATATAYGVHDPSDDDDGQSDGLEMRQQLTRIK